MVRISAGFKHKYKEQIEKYCSKHDIKIVYCQNMGGSDYYNFSCDGSDFDKLEKYIKKLENG